MGGDIFGVKGLSPYFCTPKKTNSYCDQMGPGFESLRGHKTFIDFRLIS